MKSLVFATLLIFTFLESRTQKVHQLPSLIDDRGDTSISTPQFPGGKKAYYKFLAKNLRWPKTAIDAKSRVFVCLTVEKDGSLTNFKIIRSMGKDLDNEALRVLNKSPKWIPAKKNGKSVSIGYCVLINFELSNR